VFCWRHHKNPVGKEWRWKVDGPEELVEAAITNHRSMIKQMKGVPGVDKERLEEAFTIRHCALSLVGEPIIYPYINEFVSLLHSKNISSFLVTNAQFPDKIDAIQPVTQLYVSVDAATKESLKKVDRPLFADFWERFLSCLDSLSKKGQRTVFRLTLIKEWNVEELQNYAELVERGKPSFIEIKGVTYCGTSKASSLTMKNVPFHEEVLKFSEELCNATPFLRDNYELSCEHEHSCCVLISHKKFKVNGEWHTWIDYPKFHELVQSGKPFDALDYAAKSPSWALKDSPERGFDPEETRFRRNKPYQKSGC
jgi:tRNA wybutosine-synthesizing protein 1